MADHTISSDQHFPLKEKQRENVASPHELRNLVQEYESEWKLVTSIMQITDAWLWRPSESIRKKYRVDM